MKFKIRFADQIVGVFIILSIVSLILVMVLLGSNQRWFAKDISYYTVLPSAAGLGKNMAVQYRGFTIGNVKSFHLNNNDDVEVIFVIHEEYNDRMKLGSTIEIMVSPVGLGNQFLLHTGRGDLLAEGSLVPMIGSAQARELIRQGLAVEPHHDDSITLMLNRASSILAHIDEALGQGSDITEIGKIIGSLNRTIAGLEPIPQMLETIPPMIEEAMGELIPLLANVKDITDQVNDPSGLLYKVLDTDEAVYTSLVSSLGSISTILDNLDTTTASQFPQIAGIIMELRTTIKNADDVLIALANNPLLRRGVPERVESQSGGTSPRNVQF